MEFIVFIEYIKFTVYLLEQNKCHLNKHNNKKNK